MAFAAIRFVVPFDGNKRRYDDLFYLSPLESKADIIFKSWPRFFHPPIFPVTKLLVKIQLTLDFLYRSLSEIVITSDLNEHTDTHSLDTAGNKSLSFFEASLIIKPHRCDHITQLARTCYIVM